MAPKNKKVPDMGGPVPNSGGYRAQARIDKQLYYGPWRPTENEASADSRSAQRAAAAVAHEDRDSQVAAYDAVLQKLKSAEKDAREKAAAENVAEKAAAEKAAAEKAAAKPAAKKAAAEKAAREKAAAEKAAADEAASEKTAAEKAAAPQASNPVGSQEPGAIFDAAWYESASSSGAPPGGTGVKRLIDDPDGSTPKAQMQNSSSSLSQPAAEKRRTTRKRNAVNAAKRPLALSEKRPLQGGLSSSDPHPAAEVASSGDTHPAAEAKCRVIVKSIDRPWCDDVAAGLKFFECVTNKYQEKYPNKTRLVNPFKKLKAGDLFVVLRKNDRKKVTAVAEVQSKQLLEQTDSSLLLQHLQPERHDAIKDFLADAPSFNVVFFSKVYDCRRLENLTLPVLVGTVPGLQEPRVLLGAGFLTSSKEARDALDNFLKLSECPLRCAPTS